MSGSSRETAYRGKVATLMAASPGGLGGLRDLFHVRSILSRNADDITTWKKEMADLAGIQFAGVGSASVDVTSACNGHEDVGRPIEEHVVDIFT